LKQKHLLLRVELVGLDAKYEAILQHVVIVKKKSDVQTLAQTLVRDELAHLLLLRKKQHARVMELSKKKVVSAEEVQRADAEVVKAELELARHRASVNAAGESESLRALHELLIDVQVTMAGMRAQLGLVEEELKRFESTDLRDLLRKHRQMIGELETANDARASAEKVLRLLQEAYSGARPPSVKVLGEHEKP